MRCYRCRGVSVVYGFFVLFFGQIISQTYFSRISAQLLDLGKQERRVINVINRIVQMSFPRSNSCK